MKNIYKALTIIFLSSSALNAQSPIDFNRKDCNGVQRHLFADLDSGKAVIIEFFMINCAPCPAAAQKIQTLKSNLLSQYPGKVMSYAIGFTNTYSQSTVLSWVNTNAPSAIPMDSGAVQVANYGGMGMPTVVVLAGKTTHSVLGAPYIGFNTSDTTQVASNIRSYLGAPTNTTSTVGLVENQIDFKGLRIFPTPAQSEVSVTFEKAGQSKINISIYDVFGKYLKTLDETIIEGNYQKTLALPSLPNGNYIIRITSEDKIVNQKISISN